MMFSLGYFKYASSSEGLFFGLSENGILLLREEYLTVYSQFIVTDFTGILWPQINM